MCYRRTLHLVGIYGVAAAKPRSYTLYDHSLSYTPFAGLTPQSGGFFDGLLARRRQGLTYIFNEPGVGFSRAKSLDLASPLHTQLGGARKPISEDAIPPGPSHESGRAVCHAC